MRWSIRSARNPQTGIAAFIQLSSPVACQVATTGQRAKASAATQIVGVIGSWRWRRSKRSRRSSRFIRVIDAGVSTMFGRDPFAGTLTEVPTESIRGGGGSSRAIPECNRLAKPPGGS